MAGTAPIALIPRWEASSLPTLNMIIRDLYIREGSKIATDVSIADAGSLITATDVEAALQEVFTKDPTVTLTGDVTGAGTHTNLGNASFGTTIAADAVHDSMIDWGIGANQVSADDVPDGSTNAIITLTQETNFETAYTHSQIAGGNSVHVSTTENTNWDSAYAHIHNLTTDIDHDALTNFTSDEHFTMLDEDNMVSDSATQASTQQSIKAYVDASVGGVGLYAFKTITGITNDVVADSTTDTLTLASADNKLTIVGTAATDTITFTVDQANIDHNSLANTHNLTTDINHDALTNFASNEHFLQTAITNISTALATGLVKVTTGTGALSVITDSSANWDSAFTHVSNDGSDHSFIDQSVISGATPTFGADNFSDGGSNAIITTTQETNFETAYSLRVPVADTQTIVKGSADATKLMRFEVDGLTASTTRVLTVQDKDITIADNADIPTVSDVAYDATTWDTNADASTKNAIRDKVETMDTAIGLNTAKVTNATHTGEVTGATALTIAADAVTYDKMQDTTGTDKLLGRSTAGAGTIEEIACTAAGRAILDDADASAQRTTLGVDAAGTDNSTDVTLNANAIAAGLSLATQEINYRAATNAQTGYMTAALVTNIETNNAKNTNVSTALSVGTVGINTVAITSDGGADDVTLPAATVAAAGMLTTAKWAEIVANTAKATNVSTALSAGTVNATTYGITSDGGADDIILPEADTDNAGLLGADKWDEIVANSVHTADNSQAHSDYLINNGNDDTSGSFQAKGADGLIAGEDRAGGTPNVAGVLKAFSAGDNAFYNTFTAGTNTANATYTLPVAMPGSNMVLQSTSAGVLSWVAGGDVTAGANITDNRIVRGDGGAKGVQDSGVAIDDSDNMTGAIVACPQKTWTVAANTTIPAADEWFSPSVVIDAILTVDGILWIG